MLSPTKSLKVRCFAFIAAAALLGAIGCATDDSSTAPANNASNYGTKAGALTFSACDLASSKTISVPSQCPTIQAAIDHAATGAVITVAAGTYNENLTVTKSLTLNGAGAATTKIIGPSASYATIHYGAGGGGTVNGFSVLGGSAAIDGGDVSLAGLFYPQALSLKNVTLTTTPYGLKGYFAYLGLDGVTITKASKGGASFQTNVGVSLANSAVTANSVLGFSARLVSSNSPYINVTSSTFTGNGGTGLKITTAGMGSATFNTVAANDNAGDGIDCGGITAWITTDKVSATGNTGNGAHFGTTDMLWLKGGPFSNNGKSGVAAAASSVWFSAFKANSNGLFGVDVALTSTGSNLDGLTISGNSWAGLRLSGSAATASVSSLTADSNRIAGVMVQNFGNADIYSAKITNTLPDAATGKYGDGLFLVASKVSVSSSTIKHNARAGMSAFGCNDVPGTYGGALLTVSSTLFECNGFDVDYEQASGGWSPCPAGSGKAGIAAPDSNSSTDTCTPNPATPGGTCSGACPSTPDWHGVKALSSSLEPISTSILTPVK